MIVALVAFTFTWIRLPETKGRTFDDIAELFRGADEIPLHNKMGFNTFTWPTFQPFLNPAVFILLNESVHPIQLYVLPNNRIIVGNSLAFICGNLELEFVLLTALEKMTSGKKKSCNGSFNKQYPGYWK